MKFSSAILFSMLSAASAGTNKTLAPTPGVMRPTPFPTYIADDDIEPPVVDDGYSMEYVMYNFGEFTLMLVMHIAHTDM